MHHFQILEPQIFPAGTDGRFLRKHNVPVFGFSPMANTPTLLHDHNELLNKKVYLKGIRIYEELIPALANTPPEGTAAVSGFKSKL